jgi:hypothetical protein
MDGKRLTVNGKKGVGIGSRVACVDHCNFRLLFTVSRFPFPVSRSPFAVHRLPFPVLQTARTGHSPHLATLAVQTRAPSSIIA